MPTVMRRDGFRFFFYSNEGDEPPHVHSERQGATARFWLTPVELARSRGFGDREIGRIHAIVASNANCLREVWDEFFGA